MVSRTTIYLCENNSYRTSSALRCVVEIEQVLPQQYRGKENITPIFMIYKDGGPEHRTNFMSVKLAIIALQQ